MSERAILLDIADAQASNDASASHKLWSLQYRQSLAIRGDNNPEYARYLGYLDGKELYPDMKGITLGAYFQEVLDGKGRAVYQ